MKFNSGPMQIVLQFFEKTTHTVSTFRANGHDVTNVMEIIYICCFYKTSVFHIKDCHMYNLQNNMEYNVY